MSLPSALRKLRLRVTQRQLNATSKTYASVASSSAAEPSQLPDPLSTPADYKNLFRAFGHRKFSDAYAPNPRPVALAKRNSALTPRQLYLQMRTTTKMHREDQIGVLATALCAFTRSKDYAGALVALRAVSAHVGPLNRARVIEAALKPLACRIHLEQEYPRRRLTELLVGKKSLAEAGWGVGSGSWAMPQRTKWVVERMLQFNTPKAKASENEDGVEGGLLPVAFILQQMLRTHGGVSKRESVRPWKEEAKAAQVEMGERRKRRRAKKPVMESESAAKEEEVKEKVKPQREKTRRDIPLWTGETA
ncbi:hypothetical protein R3P38DRAFT_1648972 [Favolaschia claudopus]|uniref:Uncharacterized protein n=1 Tax=Favolaschia claudopus TaxID=2862362 RepID=A0AAW0DNQ4_9AGAR